MGDFYIDIENYISNDNDIYDDKSLEYCNQIYRTDSYCDIENYDRFYANYNFYHE